EGKLIATLRSTSELVPSRLFEFDADDQFAPLLWREQQLTADALYPSRFVVGKILNEIYQLISSQTALGETKHSSYSNLPAGLDIELGGEAAWNLLLASGNLKKFAQECLYQGNSEELRSKI